MEIVFAILILIGALAAGSNPSTSNESHGEKDPVTESAEPGIAPRIVTMYGPCRLPDGRLTQRDLTVPRASTAVNSGVNSEEARHGCVDQ